MLRMTKTAPPQPANPASNAGASRGPGADPWHKARTKKAFADIHLHGPIHGRTFRENSRARDPWRVDEIRPRRKRRQRRDHAPATAPLRSTTKDAVTRAGHLPAFSSREVCSQKGSSRTGHFHGTCHSGEIFRKTQIACHLTAVFRHYVHLKSSCGRGKLVAEIITFGGKIMLADHNIAPNDARCRSLAPRLPLQSLPPGVKRLICSAPFPKDRVSSRPSSAGEDWEFGGRIGR